MKVLHAYGRDATTIAASTIRYQPAVAGQAGFGSFTTEATGNDRIRQSQTHTGLRLRLKANATTAVSTVVTRKNTADGGMTFTIAAGTAGLFEDTTGSDSLVNGDLYCHKITVGAGGVITFGYVAWEIEATSNVISRMGATASTMVTTASAIRFQGFCRSALMGVTETNEQAKVLIPVTFKHMRLVTAVNNRGTTTPLKSRVNAADGNQLISILSTSDNVELEDSTNSDSVAADDLIDWTMVNSTGTGVLNWLQLSGTLEHASKAMWFTSKPAETSPNQAVNTTRYAWPNGRTDLVTTEADGQIKIRTALRISAMRIYVPANTITANSTVTLRKNSASPSGGLVITVGSGVTGWIDATGSAVDFASGDDVGLEFITGTTGTDINWQIFIALQEDVPGGVNADLTQALPLALSATATVASTVTADLTQPLPLSLSATGTVASTVTASLTKALPLGLTATATVASTVTASLTQPLPLALSATATVAAAGVNASLTQSLPLAFSATATVASTVTTSLTQPLPLGFAATATVSSTVTADLAKALPLGLSATATVASTVTASLSQPLSLGFAATATVASTVTASLTQPLPLGFNATATVAQAGVNASLTQSLPLALTATATVASTVTATLNQPLPLGLSATVTVSSSVNATLTQPLPLGLTATATVAQAGINVSLTQPLPLALSATATVASSVTANLTQSLPLGLLATATVASTVTASLTQSLPLGFSATAIITGVPAGISASLTQRLPLGLTATATVRSTVTANLTQRLPLGFTGTALMTVPPVCAHPAHELLHIHGAHSVLHLHAALLELAGGIHEAPSTCCNGGA